MPTAPETPSPDNGASAPSLLGGLNPDELFARGMQSVRMTGGGSMQNWEPPTIEEAARLFPNYKVIDVLGRGGMGAVYKAVQTALDRVVAIKLLPLEISIDRDFADRFVREARTMAKLNHPNIVSVFDFGTTTEGHLYFVMEFVEGTTLHHLIKTTGLKPTQCLELIVNVCEALQYAHGEGVVHRDIKPANVLVDTKGRVKVADFGLARMDTPSSEQWGQTMTGMVLGTPDYMAPEQKQGARVDHRADIYSLGVMLYEMLCGQVPQGIFDPPSQRVTVDERIDQVVIRAMQQEPDRRYANTAEMKSEVENIRQTPLPNVPAPVVSGSRNAPPPKSVKSVMQVVTEDEGQFKQHKSFTPWLAGVAALCALVAVSVVIIQMMRPIPPANVPVPPPPAPELASIHAATPAPEPGPVKTEPVTAATEPVATVTEPAPAPKTEPARPAMATAPVKAEPVAEPPAPVPAPPSDRPVAVVTVPAATPVPAPPTVVQVAPPPAATTGLTPPRMGTAPVAVPVEPEPTETLTTGEDWRRYVAAGDSLMNRRQRDEAIDAYLTAFDLATDGRPVTSVEIATLCRKTANLQISLGSRAEARLTLERGRTILKKITNPKEAVERQRALEQIETQIRTLPRD
jgi:serine/threonine protein kinase